METKMAFQRNFLIFNTEDSGFGAGQKPSGHVRIEVRDGKGKLWSSVQNLAPGDGRLLYKLYLVKAGKEPATAVCAGILGLRQNKAELEWAFDPSNVYGSGYGISEFDVFAILAEYSDRDNTRIVCPLAAYRNKGTEWRKKLDRLVYAQNKMPPQKLPGKEYIAPYTKPAEEYITPIMTPATKNNYAGEENAYKEAENSYPKEENANQEMENSYLEAENNTYQEAENSYQEENTYQEAENFYYEENNYPQAENIYNEAPKNKFTPPENYPGENINAMPVQFQQHGIHMPLQEVNKQAEENPVQTPPPYFNQMNPQTAPVQVPQAAPVQVPRTAANLDSNCLYMNGNMCGMYVNTGGPSPCDTCQIHTHPRNGNKEEKKGDLYRLKDLLDRNFEQDDPFQTKRSDYRWWKVANPVNLNNILYQCNIRSPLLFNPLVMMAHFKYRYLEIGIFTDRVRKREYVVCGIPGMHMIDKKPFGEMCKWVQAEGSRPKYGGFGYWIVYLDPVTGKILSLK